MISESKSRISESRSRLISEGPGGAKKSTASQPGEKLKNIKDGPGDVLAYAEYVKAGK